jgi:23S rRNA (cytidine1920-2'-O)/16S rRNA (cytidine1409-2'-O)-methyltransferase
MKRVRASEHGVKSAEANGRVLIPSGPIPRYDQTVAKKKRLDVVIAERGLVPSRARAQALILAGKVRLNGELESKAGTQVDPEADIEISEPEHPWVSRGALKLVAALDEFEISPEDLDCLDVGASTGGFTDVLLERGARRVIALDVGRGQLDWRLRNDSRVVVLEGVNARHLGTESLPFTAALATVDVSFISLRLIIPALLPLLAAEALIICLVKPQFEAGRDQVGKGGIVRDEAVRRETIEETVRSLQALGLELVGLVESPIRGQKGNLEELAVFRTPAENA